MNPNLILVFLCLIIGVCLRRTGKFPGTTAPALNAFVIWVSLPALVLVQIPALLARTTWNAEMLIPVSMAWLLFPLSFLFFKFLGERIGWDRAVIGALVLTAGLGNTSFVGLPLLESILGPEAVGIGVLVDQPGTFLVLSTLGILFASILSPSSFKKVTTASIAKSILMFPPFVALILSVLWFVSGFEIPEAVTVLQRLAATLVPVALVAVGFQLKLSLRVIQSRWKPLALGLGFKLLLAPLFFYGLYKIVFASTAFSTRVTILEAAMAPMITAGVVAEEFGFDAEVSSLMVGVGIPLSILTVNLWDLFAF